MRGWSVDRLRSGVLSLTVVLLFAPCSTSHAQPPASPPLFVPGELLVKFKTGVSAQKATTVFATAGLQSIRHFASIDVHRCGVPEGMTVAAAVESCLADPAVEFAEPNYIYTASRLPNDPRFQELWGLHNDADTDIDAPEAWDTQVGAPGIVVGVVDTGVDHGHEDLQANMWRNPGESGSGRETNRRDDDGNGFVDDVFGWDFANDDNDPMDDNGHGSHVSGTIAATGDNGLGVTGVNWRASVMALKFLSANGSGTPSDAIEAILYAAQNGARILNNSWGGGGRSQALLEAIEVARDRNVLFVAAAGNEGRDNDRTPSYPASYEVDNILSVAAYDRADGLASFSNFGKSSVDLGAPGVEVTSTTPGNNYQSFSGTSMATPHVSGVAALLLAQRPESTYRQLRVRLAGSVEPTAALENTTWSGGRLNAAAALAAGPRVAFVTRLADTPDENGPYTVGAEAVADEAIQSVVLSYTVNSGTPATVPMPAVGDGAFQAAIPGQSLGSTISYFVDVTDAAGGTARSRMYAFRIGETAVVPGCGDFQFASLRSNQRIGLMALNLLLLVGAVFGARRLVASRRTPAAQKH